MHETAIAEAKHAAEALVQKDEVAKVRTGQSFIQADRQADRQTDRHTDRQTGRQTDRRCRLRAAKPSPSYTAIDRSSSLTLWPGAGGHAEILTETCMLNANIFLNLHVCQT